MNFWSVKNVQNYYNCINSSSSTVKNFYVLLHEKYYGSTTLLVVRSGGRGFGNLLTAVANDVATSPSARGDMIRHSRQQVSKWKARWRHHSPQPSTSFQVPCHLTVQRIYYTAKSKNIHH